MLTVTLRREVEETLARRASESGLAIEEYASQLLTAAVSVPTLDQILAPVRRRFQESGMTEEQLADLLEEEKHAMRAERRNRRAS